MPRDAGSVKVAKEKSSKLGMMSDHRHRLGRAGQRGVFAIKWTALLVHKTPILRVILAQFTVQSLRTSYVSPGSMTERLWLHPAEVPFSTVVLRESALLGDCCLRLPNAATEGGLNNPSSGQALPLN